ncbi:MAG: hypothetical protein A4S12_02960 [Proteobacteria bacterium SG_bin5]|nr:MAG: hypothetical protein A4S12_02960 [Proteobacteria bacterium SG_bin5]
MADNVENLVLEHLKGLRAIVDRIERRLEDHTNRLSNLEGGQAAIIQHLAHLSATDAAQQVSIDKMDARLGRIERRLELND